MDINSDSVCTAFEGYRRIATGALADVALKAKEVLQRGEIAPVLIFDDANGEQVDVDYSGTPADVHRKLAERMRDTPVPAPAEAEDTSGKRGPGRPKLGVVGHEVTLLPRHWDWLNSQPGGASVSLRKLVDRARKANQGTDRIRRAQEAVYRFMVAVGGNLAGFEEATRALFAGDSDRFNECIAGWPVDVRDYSLHVAAGAFAEAYEQAT